MRVSLKSLRFFLTWAVLSLSTLAFRGSPGPTPDLVVFVAEARALELSRSTVSQESVGTTARGFLRRAGFLVPTDPRCDACVEREPANTTRDVVLVRHRYLRNSSLLC